MKNIKYRFKTEYPGKDVWYIDEARGFDIVAKYYHLTDFPDFDVNKYVKFGDVLGPFFLLVWICVFWGLN